eukprot:6173453-Pleurochrysis_carterae.AAC.3
MAANQPWTKVHKKTLYIDPSAVASAQFFASPRAPAVLAYRRARGVHMRLNRACRAAMQRDRHRSLVTRICRNTKTSYRDGRFYITTRTERIPAYLPTPISHGRSASVRMKGAGAAHIAVQVRHHIRLARTSCSGGGGDEDGPAFAQLAHRSITSRCGDRASFDADSADTEVSVRPV